jgi:hypothetical protein
MDTARVLRDVAADRTRFLARRIRRIEEAEAPGASRYFSVQDTGLNPNRPIYRIDIEYVIQPRELDDERTIKSESSPR